MRRKNGASSASWKGKVKKCDEDEGVFEAPYICTWRGSFGTNSFGKIVAYVPTALSGFTL